MSEITTLCSLWKLKLKDGSIHTLTDHDAPIEYRGDVYHPQNGIEAGVSESQSGFAIDNGEIRTHLRLPDLTSGAIRAGALDNATLTQFRRDWISGETVLLSKGRIGEVRFSDHDVEVEWLGQSSLLDRSTGRVFSRHCDASFGDARCGLNIDDFTYGRKCPRTFAACRDQFDNIVNFRGFPYLLGDDALQAGVREADPRDGSSRYN